MAARDGSNKAMKKRIKKRVSAPAKLLTWMKGVVEPKGGTVTTIPKNPNHPLRRMMTGGSEYLDTLGDMQRALSKYMATSPSRAGLSAKLLELGLSGLNAEKFCAAGDDLGKIILCLTEVANN